MSVHQHRGRWRVHWREDGRQMTKSFTTLAEAVAYDNQRGFVSHPFPKILAADFPWDALPRDVRSWVYFVEAGGLWKIGFTVDPKSRISSLDLPHVPASVGLLIPGGRGVERAVHALYLDHRVGGEWFNLPANWVWDWRDEACDHEAILIAGRGQYPGTEPASTFSSTTGDR